MDNINLEERRKKLLEERRKKLEEKRKKKELEKTLARIEADKRQREVRDITITIEWKKSRTWGSNPHASAEVHFKEAPQNIEDRGTFTRAEGFTCFGCGYDKESTVIADIFNKFLKYKLYKLVGKQSQKPYGIRYWTDENNILSAHYEGGVGTSCYKSISEFIGGKFEHIAGGKSFDVYKYSEMTL